MDSPTTTTVGLVILTTGDRPDELSAIMGTASELAFDQRLIVGNGCRPPDLAGWSTVKARYNLGVPGGRSLGMDHVTTDVVVFLDDDSSFGSGAANFVNQVRQAFDASSDIGAVAFRVVIAGTNRSLRRWSPRPTRSVSRQPHDVPTFPGNGHAVRHAAFLSVGGYFDELFFKHEETELSWRLLDKGWRVVHHPDIVVEHPETSEARHARAIELGLRNKIWIARLRLPLLVAVITIAASTVRTFARCRSLADAKAATTGLRAGMVSLPAERESISWRTVFRLSRLGRPPIF